MLPEKWPLAVIEATQDQFRTVKKLIVAREVEYVVCATDAGREGELIFRFIYEAAACRKPVRRLWISSLTAGAIKAGLQVMKDGRSIRLTGGGGPRPCSGGLAGRNESVACVHDRRWRHLLRRQGADADVGDAVDREMRSARLSPRLTSKSSARSALSPTRAHGSSPARPRPRVQATPT